ncbi:hypothetical protein [Piscirickettsia litoralis]|uniref:Uncharacterized protein n=1 Tax=Piscirickettsia litoralis TaxID=1891921 RepID=A0ABX2ZZQ7_9GAMM|nr:hypothetical protein [Piscirickettsia litoralis]ODN41715.1 hypothetical protein BGC07_00340 [Piscirickettsia litoralis]
MKYFSAILLLMMISTSSLAFFGSANDVVSKAVGSKSAGSLLQSQILNLPGLNKKSDQATWSAFYNDCVKDNISKEQLASLVSGGISRVTDFLSHFKAPTKAMTTIYNKAVSCPHAIPLVQKMLKPYS